MINNSDADTVHSTEFAARVRANQRSLAARLNRHYDYIICGAGSAGSVVAGRLAVDPHINVLLLEAGGTDDMDMVMDPDRWPSTLGSTLDWGFRAEPNARLNNRSILYSMGKVLGGGSSINVCTWSRGHRSDWDGYAMESADPAWNYESVLAQYRRIEDWRGTPDFHYRGVGGPVHVRPAQNPHPFFEALLDGASSCGIPRFPDANGSMMEAAQGCSLVDEIVSGRRRQSIFQSYVYPQMDRPNITVLTEALVTRIIFTGRRGVGVEFRHGGQKLRANAGVEVVISLGAVQTPKLLMQSGIGNPAELTRFDIPLVQSLTGVGRNLHDHTALGCVWETAETSMPSAPRGQAACFWKSRPDLKAPNFYLYARPGASATAENAARFPLPKSSWSLSVGMRPASRGEIHLTGPDAADAVKIDAAYLADTRDLSDLLDGIAMAREIGNSLAFKSFTRREVAPGALNASTMQEFVRNGLVTFWHQCGTAKMGRDNLSVVDARLKVYGIEGLRIADASILPHVTAGNTMAPCVLIGEQAASFLLGEGNVRVPMHPQNNS